MCRQTRPTVPRLSPDVPVLLHFLTSLLRAGLNTLPKLSYPPKFISELHLSHNTPDLVFVVLTRYVAKANDPSTVAVLFRLL